VTVTEVLRQRRVNLYSLHQDYSLYHYPFQTWARRPMGFSWARYKSPVEPRPVHHWVQGPRKSHHHQFLKFYRQICFTPPSAVNLKMCIDQYGGTSQAIICHSSFLLSKLSDDKYLSSHNFLEVSLTVHYNTFHKAKCPI